MPLQNFQRRTWDMSSPKLKIIVQISYLWRKPKEKHLSRHCAMIWPMSHASLFMTLMQLVLTVALCTRHALSATPPTIAQSWLKSSPFRTSRHASWEKFPHTRRCRLMIRLTWLRTNSEKPSTWTEEHQTDSTFAVLLGERRCCLTRCACWEISN